MFMSWQRSKRLIAWLGEGRALYISTLCVLISLLSVWACDWSERSLRLSGLALQILGIGTVIWGIAVTRKQFGHPPVFSLVKAWVSRCPAIRRQGKLEPESIRVGAEVVGISLTTIFIPSPTAPIEDRLAHIERGLETIQMRIDTAEAKIQSESSAFGDKILVESRARQAGDEEVMRALELSSTGGVSITAMGSVWLFVGVVLSTASQELTAWLG